MADWRKAADATGRAAATVGKAVARQVAKAYHSVDPDVFRHLAQVPLMSYSLLVPRRGGVEPGKSDGHPPLVFVHGLAGNRGNFLLMAGALWLRGRKRSYQVHLESERSIEELADDLARFVAEVVEASGEPQVEIVAHSMGGLVARLAVVDGGMDGAVKTLITLGTPHGGTYSARFANTPVTRDLRPESALIRRLVDLPWPDGVRCVALWSANDLLVVPGENAALEGAESIEMTPFTHYSYLVDPKGWSAVGRLLEGRPVADRVPAGAP